MFPFEKEIIINESSDFLSRDLSSCVELPISPKHPGSFGFKRKYHIHEGVDIYTPFAEPVYACESGYIRAIEQFTGTEVGSPWWHKTFYVVVEHETVFALYGEISPCVYHLGLDSFVSEGQLLGHVIPVLINNKGRPDCMLHFETYETSNPSDWAPEWKVGSEKPQGLVDPTPFLLRQVMNTP